MSLFWKDLFRTIRFSIGRFLAIAGICALGIGFFGGLQMTCGSMKQVLTTFYNDTNMMDIRVVCSLGISDKNVDDMKNIDGVNGVMPAYESDILTNFGNDQTAVRVHSLPDNMSADNNDYINRQILTRGDWPQNDDECVLSDDVVLASPPNIGDQIDILECSTGMDKTFKSQKLKVVGFVSSSYYVNATQMGSSTLGKGIVNDYAYVKESAFKDDFPYSEIFLTVCGAKNFTTGTDEYQHWIDQVMERIVEQSPVEAEIRTASVKSDAQSKLDDARDEFNKQKQNAEKELNKNEKELQDAWAKIESGQMSLSDFQKMLDDGYAAFEKAKQDVLNPIKQARQAAQMGLATVNSVASNDAEDFAKINTINNSIISIGTSRDWNALEPTLSRMITQIETSKTVCEQSKNTMIAVVDDEHKANVSTVYDAKQQSLEYLSLCVIDFKSAISSSESSIEDVYNQKINDFNSSYSNFNTKYQTCNILVTSTANSLQTALSQIDASEQIAMAGFAQKQAELDASAAQIKNSQSDLDSGKAQYYDGLKKFIEAKNSALTSLDDAQAKLNSSQNDIDNIEDAKFFVMDRTKNFGAINFKNDAERIASIANVFPLIFFFVALLVALTSMTRMIEEERIAIGTHKALGFSRLRISMKYLLYGAISSFVGSFIGVLILGQVLPYIIMFAYSIMYKLPIPLPMPFDVLLAMLAVCIGIGVTLIATLMAALGSLRLAPAHLMIPTAPKAGKRILLEYVRPLWKRINFNWKITLRNMFLYKRRLFMTLIGIAGCTALLLVGFGLHNSISDILDKQFNDIVFDNFKITYNSDASDDSKKQLEDKFADIGDVKNTLIYEENMVCMPQGHPNASTTLCVPQDASQFENLRVLQNRQSKQMFCLHDDGVLISEKLATMMQVSAGDKITVYNQDTIGNAGDDEYQFEVAGIVENYIAHYIYMTPTYYQKHFNKECKYNGHIARVDLVEPAQQEFIDNVKSVNGVDTAFFTQATRETYEKMLQSVNMVVVVLIVSAGLLAFVVLYNLININICERAREIATLKVLGANSREINMYIHRETFMLSFIGAILGIALGFIMEQFVILSAEVDYVMFGRDIHLWSILVSLLITLCFTILVASFMRKKLYSISMVESLKSIE